MKTTTAAQYPVYDDQSPMQSATIGRAYNSLRERAIKMEIELLAFASMDCMPETIKINIHNVVK